MIRLKMLNLSASLDKLLDAIYASEHADSSKDNTNSIVIGNTIFFIFILLVYVFSLAKRPKELFHLSLMQVFKDRNPQM